MMTDTAGGSSLSPCWGTDCGLGGRTVGSDIIDQSLDGEPQSKRRPRPSRAAVAPK